jgi:hypothetical protein
MLSAFRKTERPSTKEDPATRLGLLIFQGHLKDRSCREWLASEKESDEGKNLGCSELEILSSFHGSNPAWFLYESS